MSYFWWPTHCFTTPRKFRCEFVSGRACTIYLWAFTSEAISNQVDVWAESDKIASNFDRNQRKRNSKDSICDSENDKERESTFVREPATRSPLTLTVCVSSFIILSRSFLFQRSGLSAWSVSRVALEKNARSRKFRDPSQPILVLVCCFLVWNRKTPLT